MDIYALLAPSVVLHAFIDLISEYKVDMAEDGEDWESECCDSTAVSHAVPTVNIINCASLLLNDIVSAVECDAVPPVSDVLSSSAAAAAGGGDLISDTQHCCDGGVSGGGDTYVSDSRKVFVSNVNYRVS